MFKRSSYSESVLFQKLLRLHGNLYQGKWCISAFLEALSSFWTSRSHWSKQITCKNMTKVSPDQIQCIKYAVIFAHKGKNNTFFGTVKGLFVFVCTHNINITLCVCKIKKTNRMQFLPSRSWRSASQKFTETQQIFSLQIWWIYL